MLNDDEIIDEINLHLTLSQKLSREQAEPILAAVLMRIRDEFMERRDRCAAVNEETRRYFETYTTSEMVGSGNQAAKEPAVDTHRSEAKESHSHIGARSDQTERVEDHTRQAQQKDSV